MQILENIGDPVLVDETAHSATWKWTIRDLSRYFKIGRDSFMSHEFSVRKGHRSTRWKLMLYPNGQEGFPDGESMTINLVSLDQFELRLGYKFGIFDAEGEKVVEHRTRQTLFHSHCKVTPAVELLKREKISTRDNRFVRDDVLNVSCKMFFEPAIRNVSVNGRAIFRNE